MVLPGLKLLTLPVRCLFEGISGQNCGALTVVIFKHTTQEERTIMKKLFLVAALLTTASAFTSLPAEAGFKANQSKYCMSNGYDPLCMSKAMMHERMMHMKMTKKAVMANRTKYCMSHTGDPICDKQNVSSTLGL
jgi:hypothetical protein